MIKRLSFYSLFLAYSLQASPLAEQTQPSENRTPSLAESTQSSEKQTSLLAEQTQSSAKTAPPLNSDGPQPVRKNLLKDLEQSDRPNTSNLQALDDPMYLCTASDEKFFSLLMNLIGSIHRVNFDELEEIAVFDLGLLEEQRATLETIEKVHVYDVEMTHPHLLTPFIREDSGRQSRGWYAWKPVVLKQALDMFPYVLYLDAGMIVLKPLDDLFKHIRQNGHFLTDSSHNIKWMTTRYLIDRFDLKSEERSFILDEDTCGIAAGLQGLTHELYDSYVMPMYELSKEMRPFMDDGTTPDGFGTGRHDQALFSIYARLLNLKITMYYEWSPIHRTWSPHYVVPPSITVDGKEIPFYINSDRSRLRNDTVIYIAQGDPLFQLFKECIRYKKAS